MPGFLSRLALGLEPAVTAVTWPSAAAALVTHQLVPHQFAFDGTAVVAYQTAREAQIARLLAWQSQELGVATAVHDVPYAGVEPLWALVCGYMARRIGGTRLPEEIAPGAYRHQYELAARVQHEPWTLDDGFTLDDGLILGTRRVARGTLAARFDDGTTAELRSAMVATAALTGGVGAPWQLGLSWQGYDLVMPGVVNTPGVFVGLAGCGRQRVLWHHSVIRLAPSSPTEALDSGDTLTDLAAIALTIDHGLLRAQSTTYGLAIDEPATTGLVTVSGSLRFPYRSPTPAALWSGQRNLTAYMLDMQATGSLIPETSTPYAFRLYVPSLLFTTAPRVVSGPGMTAVDLPFTCLVPASPAAGMPPTVQPTPLIVELVTGEEAHPWFPSAPVQPEGILGAYELGTTFTV